MNIPTIIEAGGYPALIIAFGLWIEGRLSPATKQRLADWIKQRPPKYIADIRGFRELFDDCFTDKHFTLLCFLRSTAISLICFLSIALISLIRSMHVWLDTDRNFALEASNVIIDDWPFVKMNLTTLIATNILADYLSLFTTRSILNRLNDRSNLALAAFIGLDSFLNIAVWIVFYVLSLIIVLSLPLLLIDIGVYPTWNILRHVFLPAQLEGTAVFILTGMITVPVGHETSESWIRPVLAGSLAWGALVSTFITSIWLWIYIGVGFLVRLLNHLTDVSYRVSKYWNIDEHPVQLVALVLAVLTFTIYWLVIIIYWMVKGIVVILL